MTEIQVAQNDFAAGQRLPEQDAGPVWQPYLDPPLLTPQMALGLDAASSEESRRLLRYLAALVAARQAPVHVNVAFNAAYFGFDLPTRSYVGGALNDLFSFPEVHVEVGGDALPVGALINIATGARPLFAEVVYKEGAHPLLDDSGSLPDWVSGAPAAAVGPGQASDQDCPVLRERLVVDVDAFGANLSVTDEQLNRMRVRGRDLNADGHVLIGARYETPDDADLDEVSFYARYLMTRGREQLLSASAPLPLAVLLTEDAGDQQYGEALLGLLRTVEQALQVLPELRMWRGYAFTRESLGARLRDAGPLGGDDLATVAVQLGRAAVPDRPTRWGPARNVTYTAIGPRLRELQGSADPLQGLGYALAVCHANAVVSDYARRDADEETGLLPGEVSLRLDDPWQGGGIWRAEHPGSSYARVDPTQPLGLGWQSSLPDQAPPPGLSLSPEPETEFAESDLMDGGVVALSVADSQVSWSQALRLSHQVDGRLPLPEQVVAQIRMSGGIARLRLWLAHDGYQLDRGQAQQDARTELHGARPQLSGIDWPLEFFPGILLTFTWPRGGSVVRATSTLLETPVTVDGIEIEHRYEASILTRDAAPGEARRHGRTAARGSTGTVGTLTLEQRVLRAVRRLGLLDPGGRAILARSSLTAAVYGSVGLSGGSGLDSGADAALGGVIDRLVRDGDLTLGLASTDASGRLRFPAGAGQRPVEVLVYTPAIITGTPRPGSAGTRRALNPNYLRTVEVTGHLRSIGHLGRAASPAARTAYRDDRQRLGLAGPVELPDGYTYVTPFTRGG
jgi:hypothetical protein